MKIVFVILNYLSYIETEECVQSILLNIDYSNIDIVIVDNGSSNNSFEILQEKYIVHDSITVLHSTDNKGFAKGNNIGYQYAKETLYADFIVMCNNDTYFLQHNFCNVILNLYKKYRFYVLGPDIITPEGLHQNPCPNKKWNHFTLRYFRFKQYIRIFLSYIGLDYYLFALKKILWRNKNKRCQYEQFNVMLHGACLIFSQDFIKKFDGLDSRTFLYLEEDILKLYAEHYNFLIMYSPDLLVNHKEDVATNQLVPNSSEKDRFIFRERIKSSKVLDSILDEFKGDK